MSDQRYNYCFATWPSEVAGWRRATFDLFRMFDMRVEKIFTEAEFEQFRNELSADGLTLREIERVPYHDPETVL